MAVTSQTQNSSSDLDFDLLHIYLLVRHYHTSVESDIIGAKEAYAFLEKCGYLHNISEKEADENYYELSEQARTYVLSLILAPKPVAVTRWVIPKAHEERPKVLYYRVPALSGDRGFVPKEPRFVYLTFDKLSLDEKERALAGEYDSEYRAV